MVLDIALGIVLAIILLSIAPYIIMLGLYLLALPFILIGMAWDWIRDHVTIK